MIFIKNIISRLRRRRAPMSDAAEIPAFMRKTVNSPTASSQGKRVHPVAHFYIKRGHEIFVWSDGTATRIGGQDDPESVQHAAR